MNKIAKYALFLAITLILVLPAKASYSSDAREIFGDKDEADVIILLKEDYGFEEIDLDDADINQKKIMGYARESIVKELELSTDFGNNFELTNAYSSFNGIAGRLKKSQYDKLVKNEKVLSIVKSDTNRLFLKDSVPQISAPPVWNTKIDNVPVTGKGETVCVVDTGVDYTHPSLGGCTKDSFLNRQCGKVLAGFDFVNNDNDPMDDLGHGTHVAGIIASADNTYRGVAPEASITAVKVCDFFCQDKDILAGMDWCINNAEKYNISAISMSLGSFQLYNEHCDDEPRLAAYKIAVDKAVAQKIAVIVATGNSRSTKGISSPACIKNATSVGSVTKKDQISDFSNRNVITDLLAPGGEAEGLNPCPTGNSICSTWLGGGFIGLSGTSMATPHVSGAFVLMRQFKKLQENIVLTPSQIENVLNATGFRINDIGGSGLTFSRINLYAALVKLNQTQFGPGEKFTGGIEITNVKAKLDGKKSSLDSSGRIRKSAKPQSKLELSVDLKNNFSQSRSVEIEDVKLKVTIEDIDDDSDLKEESRKFDLSPQQDKTLRLKFEVPLSVEEGSYDILIEVKGEDKEGKEYKESFRAEIDVDKDKHKLILSEFAVGPKAISCSRNINLRYEIMNLGEEDEQASFKLENQALGMIFEQNEIEIPEDISENTFSKSVNIKLKDSIESGIYPLSAKAYSGSRLQDSKAVNIEIRDCDKPKQQKSEEEVMVLFGSESRPKFSENTKMPKTMQAAPLQPLDSSFWILALGGIVAVGFLITASSAALFK